MLIVFSPSPSATIPLMIELLPDTPFGTGLQEQAANHLKCTEKGASCTAYRAIWITFVPMNLGCNNSQFIFYQ
jgi:hypothetical protein